ncbi:MAG: cobalt-precorrin-6A reductase [Sneathiella sp.]
MNEQKNILLIGGTEEAVVLNRELSARPDVALVTSLAGRTALPAALTGRVVTGGFGGAAGLADFIVQSRIDLVIDASHPFAGQITRAAFSVCSKRNVPFIRYQRFAWEKQRGDSWISVRNMEEAAENLGNFERIFLTIGRQELASFEKISGKSFLARTIEPIAFNPENSHAELIQARGPFTIEDELRLLTDRRIELLVSKNSGGTATYAKIEAARQLQIPVLMIERPEISVGATKGRLSDVLAAVDDFTRKDSR